MTKGGGSSEKRERVSSHFCSLPKKKYKFLAVPKSYVDISVKHIRRESSLNAAVCPGSRFAGYPRRGRDVNELASF